MKATLRFRRYILYLLWKAAAIELNVSDCYAKHELILLHQSGLFIGNPLADLDTTDTELLDLVITEK